MRFDTGARLVVLKRSRRLLVVARGLLQLIEMREIVLDPELRAGLFDESFYRSPARQRLIAIELKRWGLVRVAFLLIVIQVSGQQDRPRLCELQIHHLVSRAYARKPP